MRFRPLPPLLQVGFISDLESLGLTMLHTALPADAAVDVQHQGHAQLQAGAGPPGGAPMVLCAAGECRFTTLVTLFGCIAEEVACPCLEGDRAEPKPHICI